MPRDSDFRRDDDWQRKMRDAVLAPELYGKYSRDGRYVFIDKGRCATLIQKRFAVDTIVQGRRGDAICIEEKIVRWPGYAYTAVCLETHSCTVPGHESDGWMKYGEADYLLYCCAQANDDLDCWLMEFQPLKQWFWSCADEFPDFQMANTLNRTKGKKVPIQRIRKHVTTKHIYLQHPDNSRNARLFDDS